MCYVNSTLKYRMVSWISDKLEDLEYCAFADADFAGDCGSSRSTSGGLTCLSSKLGLPPARLKKEADGKPAKYPPQPTPTSFATLSGLSKKQTAVSHSTPEAEIVAADAVIRGEGIPLLDFMDKMLNRPVTMHFYEDNEAAELIIKPGGILLFAT